MIGRIGDRVKNKVTKAVNGILEGVKSRGHSSEGDKSKRCYLSHFQSDLAARWEEHILGEDKLLRAG